jgi:hypothetical protein
MKRRQKNFHEANLPEYTVVKSTLSNGVPLWH